MKKNIRFVMVAVLGISLAGCASTGSASTPISPPASAQPPATVVAPAAPSSTPSSASTETSQELTRSDGQGAVTVEIKPLNLDHPGDTLDFDVVMNTHSVDLGMDLTQLATLTTDSSQPIPASKWDTPQRGGHHVSGTLSFPTSYDEKPVLPGATRITITIKNIDAATRLFTWQIPQ